MEGNTEKGYKSRAKSIRGLILGLIAKFREDAKRGISYTPLELQKVFEEALVKYNKLIVAKKIIEVENIERWKGKNSYKIYMGVDSIFRINEYRKNKETGEITKSTKEVEPDKINFLLSVIRSIPLGTHYSARYFWRKIINHYGLDVDIEAFNGGKYRSEVYFPYYMYPLKCIEAMGLIRVVDGKGGGVVRLR